MATCKQCSSYAINHHCHGRNGSDGDLCDVCYWRKRARDSQRYQWLSDYLVGERTDKDGVIVCCDNVAELSNVIDSFIESEAVPNAS